MCWTRRWSPAAHALFGIAYICAGAVQLVAGVFFLISLPVFKIGSNIWTGAWNIVIGIVAAMLACIGDLTPKKQESLLYFAISILAFNAVNLVVLELGEWNLFLTEDVSKLISQNNLRKLIFYARITTTISSAFAVITSFIDTQFTYCSMQRRQKPKNVHEQVSDIEYIIPRKKTSSVAKQAQNIYSQYAQSWVFDTDTTSSSKNESPYLKLPNNVQYDTKTFGTRKHSAPKVDIICDEQSVDQKMFLVNPTVHVEPVSDESNGGRSLNYMKSFSRTPSPVGVSESSSQDSSFNPPIYECLERLTEPTLYRSRLNTAISLNAEQNREAKGCDARTLEHAKSSHSLRPRSDTFSKERLSATEVLSVPEKVQYASLMVELQQAIRSKKEKLQQPLSPQSTCESITVEDCSERTQTESKGSNSLQESSLDNSQRTEQKGSDTEFSKELEAALQLIQDLESPNTIETPSETCRSINGAELVVLPGGSVPVVSVKWRDSDASASGSTKTLSECVSPPELPADSSQGKATSVVVVASAGSGSQSSSGYSSPSHGNSKQHTPSCSKPPSVSGSSCNLVGGTEQQVSYAICNTSGAAIISLYSPPGAAEAQAPEKKKKIPPPPPPKINVRKCPEQRKSPDGGNEAEKREVPSMLSPGSAQGGSDVVLRHGKEKLAVRASSVPNGSGILPEFKLDSEPSPASTLRASTSKWNVKSLLRKKPSPPMLTPELEGAIFKSESLAYLTELELLARHARNKSIQRQIEQRVQQQILGHSSSESQC